MKFKNRWEETRFCGVISASLATLLGLVLLIYPIGDGLTRLSYDLPFGLRSDVKPEGVVIIYMDEDSHIALKQEYFLPWDRSIHARLLDQLKASATKAVAFDILFDVPTTNDLALSIAMKRHGRVVLGARPTPVGMEGIGQLFDLRLPTEQLQLAGRWGVSELAESDEVVRRHYYSARHSTNYASMAWRTAELAGVAPMPDPRIRRWLNYYGPPGTIPWVSYAQVLSNNLPTGVLSNKVIFVGALISTGFTGGKNTDDFRTPYSIWTGTKSAGVELNATAYLNLARGDWLVRLAPVQEFLIILALGLLLGFGLSALRPLAAGLSGAVVAFLFLALACVGMWRAHVWFPWAIPALVQLPVAMACAIVFRAQKLQHDKQSLEEMLANLGAMRDTSSNAAATATSRQPQRSSSVVVRQHVGEHFQSRSPAENARQLPPVVPPAQAPHISDYSLLRRVGAGAYGEVWLATNVIGAYRAAKIVYRRNFRDNRPYEREFDGIKHFDPISRKHPGLVHLLQVGRNDNDGYFYYLMELADDCSGAPTFSIDSYEPKTLGKEFNKRGRLPALECVRLGLALTDSLGYLHQHGLIHRDIKPANIIFVDGKPKLADIGLVTQIGESGTFVGTEGFYPPEGPGSPAGDLFSLGKVLYEAVTGFSRNQFPDLPIEVGSDEEVEHFMQFNRIIVKACENNVQKRYRSAQEMHHDLQRLLEPRGRWRNLLKNRPAHDVHR